MTPVTARWRWRLVRRWQFRRALVALRDGRADDALQGLTHASAIGDQRAEALYAIATVMAAPTLPNAAQCVGVLEEAAQGLDQEALSLATAALEPVLRPGLSAGPELLAEVAQLSGQLMRVAGPLPWGRYNLAVYALRVGEFGAAAGHLASDAVAPAEGWPPSLLGAACAAVLGDPAALSRWLTGPVAAPDFADDHRFLTGVRDMFEALRDDRPVEVVRLGAAFGEPSGPLTRTVPQLSALKNMLTDLVRGIPPRTRPTELGECVWGRWLCDRLQYAGGDATDVLAACAQAGGEEPALTWQRLGSQQDLLPLLPEQTARTLRRHLADMGEHLAPTSVWTRLVELRLDLDDKSATVEAGSSPEALPCPWWPADGALQTVARREGEVELRYLEGRQALRRSQPSAARRRFEDARTRVSGGGMATRLVALRFGPLLDYWEGVTLAHLGHADEAARLLRACVKGVKAREARAQLGLLTVAAGDHDGAAKLLSTIREPRPPSADYLAALLATRTGDPAEAERRLERIEERERAAGVYVAAGHRLRGRVHESVDNIADAARWYRKALTHQPDDTVAAVRLARVWLRQRHDADVPPEPLLDGRWPGLTAIAWAAPLLLVRDCLDGPSAARARELLERVPADPGLRLLVLRSAVAAGEETAAAEAARAWAEEVPRDPRMIFAMRVAQAAELLRDFCLTGGEGAVRMVELERELRGGTADPVTAFWAEAVRLMLSPDSIATAPPFPAMDDEARSAPVRLFAGLMSIFSDDSDQRRKGARCCRDALEAEPVEDGLARAAVACLAADALGDDRAFLAAYGEIETETRALPCDPAAGYLTAAEARLRVGDLDAVVQGFIPEPLADLTHPGVRRAMGVAYARRAVRVADRDMRAAIRDLDQARELLQETA